MKKKKDLAIILAIYIIAFLVGYVACWSFSNIILRFFVFDVVATVITFFFSVVLKNSSVYDAYWSLTPMIMSIWLFERMHASAPMQLLFLLAFNIWSARLTINWVTVFTDFSYEDWRYRKYRDETPRIFWPIVNFWGIHMMPTLIVFAGMLPLFEIVKSPLGSASLPGIAILLFGVGLEFFADRQMHEFLSTASHGDICHNGLWKYSRHPNYLGEITVWLGTYLTMLPYALHRWYYGIGFVAVAVLFNVVSIPLMETRQLSRREEYAEYQETTSRLLLRRSK